MRSATGLRKLAMWHSTMLCAVHHAGDEWQVDGMGAPTWLRSFAPLFEG